MKILLSPAKSLNETCPVDHDFFSIPWFTKESESLVKKLRKMKANQLVKMMHISSELADLNEKRFKNWVIPSEKNDSHFQSIFAFNGEAYRGLNPETLTDEQLSIAQDRLRILSGLYGILKPMDLFVPYRLEMGTKWQISPKQKNLYSFWGDKLTMFLNAELQKNEVVVNLASNEYAKAINSKKLKARLITPIFKEFKNGEYKVVMMYAKHARGKMSRYLIQNEIVEIEELKLYNEDGYSFDVNQSNEHDWVFVR